MLDHRGSERKKSIDCTFHATDNNETRVGNYELSRVLLLISFENTSCLIN